MQHKKKNLIPDLLPGFSNVKRLGLQYRKINLFKTIHSWNLISTSENKKAQINNYSINKNSI